MVIFLYTHHLTTMNAVPYPSEKSEVGLCLLKYAYCLVTTDETTFSQSSFDKDGHESAIIENPSFCVSPDVLNRLRLDVLKLVCEVTCKYQSVRKAMSLEENKSDCATQCDCTTNGSPNCDVDCEDQSTDTLCTSKFGEPSLSDNSDRTYHPAYDDDDDEPDDSQDMYNKEPNHDAPRHVNTHSPQECNESGGMTDSEDDSNVDEMYSDFKEDGMGRFHDVDACDAEDIDNLVCPGDVLEYSTIDDGQTARRSPVDTIIESGTDTYVVLKDGTLLRPKTHSVRKVKFYDGCNQELIPNPLAEWHRLDKCILQSVITVNLICPGDMIQYCTVGGDQTIRQSSVVTIVDGESDAYVILKNGSILQPKKHSLRKVDLFDEFKQELIPNPLDDWYRLEKYVLKPGSTTLDDDGKNNEINEPDDTDVSRARAERRRQNKQK